MSKISDSEALELIAEAINEDIGAVTATTELSSLEGWDSMGALLLMAEFDERFELIIDQEVIEGFVLVGDILKLLKNEDFLQ